MKIISLFELQTAITVLKIIRKIVTPSIRVFLIDSCMVWYLSSK